MSQLNGEFVKQGYWINNAKGPVLGQTITTSTKTGNIIVALMAVLTTLGTSHLWNLIVFFYHQKRAHTRQSDGLLKQQQALMRTLPAPGVILTDCVKLWWVWRKRTDRVLLRSLPLMSLALIFTAVTVVVGIFSSYLVDSTNITVLVKSPYCGPIDFEGADVANDSTAIADYRLWVNHYMSKVGNLANSYKTDCYVNRTTIPERCRIFTTPTLPVQQERTACPFEASMCLNISQPGLTTDTGLLDYNDYFGLNLAAKDRMKFRRRTTCAVMDLDDYTQILNGSEYTEFERVYGFEPYAEEKVLLLYLGETMAENNTLSLRYMPLEHSKISYAGSQLKYPSPFWDPYGSTFSPIPRLRNDDSDLVVVYVTTRGVRYWEPVDDPLFSAHKVIQQLLVDNSTIPNYLPDAPMTAFGCQQQYQFCFNDQNGQDSCTELQGLPSKTLPPGLEAANQVQLALLNLTASIAFWNGPMVATDYLTPSKLQDGMNAALPSDQWLQEIVSLEQTLLAQMQVALSSYSVGLSTLDLGSPSPMRRNATEGEKALCSLQRMQSPGQFANINVFALAFVVTFCVVVTALDLVLLKFLIFWHRFKDLMSPRIDAWIQDGVFQLQRRAYEARGEGSWIYLDREVPATRNDAQLGTLPIESMAPCNCLLASFAEDKPLSKITSACEDEKKGTKHDEVEVEPTAPLRQDTAVTLVESRTGNQ